MRRAGLLLPLALAACVADSESSTSEETQAVIGGQDLTFAPGQLDLPIVAINVNTGLTTKSCTAVRVGPRHLMTAAHCVANVAEGAPLDILAGSPPTLIASASIHQPLTLLQDGIYVPGLAHADIAVITFDARRDGYHDLEELDRLVPIATLGEGSMVWRFLRDPIYAPYAQAIHFGYGCAWSNTSGNHTADAGVLRFGVAPAVEAPAEAAHLNEDLYFVTRGPALDFHDPSTNVDDEPVGPGTGICHGDSGGPVYFGSEIVGVNSAWLAGGTLTDWHNFVAIPDLDFVTSVRTAGVIDVVAKRPDDLDPLLERPGRIVEVYPDVEGHDEIYVKGYQLEYATFLVGDTTLPIVDLELVSRDGDVETVKLTVDPDTLPMSGRLAAFHPPLPGQDTMMTTSKTVVQIHAPRRAWRRYQAYRGLLCGETYLSTTGACDGAAPGLQPVTVVRSTIYETTLADEEVRLERVEGVSTALAYESTILDNHIPANPFELGYYRYETISCNEGGNGDCARIFIDFQYRDEELVEAHGTQCRHRKRRYYNVLPWLYLLGEPFDLTDLVGDMINQLGTAAGFQLGAEIAEDGDMASCDSVAAAHPDTPPFDIAANGAVIPHTGWERLP